MILVTGGAGFIGSNVVQKLVSHHEDVIVVDSLGCHAKWRNLIQTRVWHWYLPNQIDQALAHVPDVIIHMGALSNTTQTDGDWCVVNNIQLSAKLADWCHSHNKPFIYASSASTYGDGALGFADDHDLIPTLKPLNLYAWSKHQFDLRQIHHAPSGNWMGLKFFNVYGAHEQHKQDQSSVIYKLWDRCKHQIPPQLFESTHAHIAHGEQQRDFVWVTDCVDVIWFMLNNPQSGIFNVGSGQPDTFNTVVNLIRSHAHKGATWSQTQYVPMPDQLKDHYQSYTCAPIAKLRSVGYTKPMTPLADGVKEYVRWLEQHHA